MSGKRKLSFKWFGSLSNLSFRRGSASDKSTAKSPSSKSDGGQVPNAQSSPVAVATTVDDMDMMRPRTSSYARSSDSYTHMGTLPRLLQRKRDKSVNTVKGRTKKTKEKTGTELGRSQSQRPAGDCVCNSPLLMVLSNQPRSRQEKPLSSPSAQAGPGPSLGKDHGLPHRGGSLGRSGDRYAVAHCEGGDPHQGQLTSQEVWSGTSNAAPVTCEDQSKNDPGTDAASTFRAKMDLPPLPGQLDSMSSQTQASVHNKPSPRPDFLMKTQQKPESRVTQQSEEGLPRESADNVGTDDNSSSLLETASCASSGRNSGQNKATKPVKSPTEPTEDRGEYVEFSKEKYLLESPPEKLRKELEEELKLSSSDIRSHGWYHGHIPREVSETVVLRNGDFLIRDSLVNMGDYVLTTRWNHEVLHFKITKVLVKTSNDSKVQYLLETESFNSIPELVRFYVSGRRPVSQPSGAQIYCPIIRTLPLRYLEATFALANSRHGSAHSPSSQRGAYIKRRSVTMNDGLTTEKLIPHSDVESTSPVEPPVLQVQVQVPGPTLLPPIPNLGAEAAAVAVCSPSTIHNHKDALRNCAMSMDQIQEYRCPLSPVGETPLSPAYSHVHRHRTQSGGRVLATVPPSPVLRRSSDPQLSPGSNNNLPDVLAVSSTPGHGPYPAPADGSETGGSYCDLRPSPGPCPGVQPCAVPPTPPAKSYVERLRVEEGRGVVPEREEGAGGEAFSAPLVETASSFRPGKYISSLMPQENKPLEMSVLKRIKELLAEADARTVAKHITMADCKVARILGVTKEMQRMMGVGSGLELLTLPHGHQLRLDLLERFYTMSIMMAVDLLGCTGSTEERASLLHKTIQLAAQLKSNLGNMFGFAAVMRALDLPQISRLEQTWMTLRQRHTEGAILYEKKLKPFMKNMNDGKESSVLSNTSFPHVIPLLALLERGVAVGEGLGVGIEAWENAEAGVDVVMSHLEAARMIAHHGGLYRTNAETKLQGFQERGEILEIFTTDFQMRLLWGSRGSEGSQSERYEKFDKVLTALSHKLEPPVRHSEL
ncbi:SH2 domain-containing protein 3C isoform X2 [Esox lucius]|uniref:SH2 domain-containing protein 3C isoform X2 n=1 Tax=Esox lucius TaxID=8010 RepID=UPI001477146A|nr:SH2 domain-containing protein 3C isoform X2 [Esox lucius]